MREQSACPYEFLESLFGNIHETEDILRVCRQDLVFRTMKIPDDIALYLPVFASPGLISFPNVERMSERPLCSIRIVA